MIPPDDHVAVAEIVPEDRVQQALPRPGDVEGLLLHHHLYARMLGVGRGEHVPALELLGRRASNGAKWVHGE